MRARSPMQIWQSQGKPSTTVPAFIPYRSNQPWGISSAYRIGRSGQWSASLCGCMSRRLMMRPVLSMKAMLRGSGVLRIQKQVVVSLSNTNNMPWSGGRDCRNISPRFLTSGVAATSTYAGMPARCRVAVGRRRPCALSVAGTKLIRNTVMARPSPNHALPPKSRLTKRPIHVLMVKKRGLKGLFEGASFSIGLVLLFTRY